MIRNYEKVLSTLSSGWLGDKKIFLDIELKHNLSAIIVIEKNRYEVIEFDYSDGVDEVFDILEKENYKYEDIIVWGNVENSFVRKRADIEKSEWYFGEMIDLSKFKMPFRNRRLEVVAARVSPTVELDAHHGASDATMTAMIYQWLLIHEVKSYSQE